MNRLIRLLVATVLMLALLCANSFGVVAASQSGLNMGGISIQQGDSSQTESTGAPIATVPTIDNIEYVPVSLSEKTRNFFATVDHAISVTLISSERDFVAGDYLKYYYGYTSDTLQNYYDVVNTLKTIAELNTNVKLNFVDPFSVSEYTFIANYKKYKLKYGDIMLSCTVNFDGSPKQRNSVIRAKSLFIYADDNKQKVESVKVEDALYNKLSELSSSRDINVAYIDEISLADTFRHVKSYMAGSGYNLDAVSLKTEQLNGYDMLIICSPVRDITLEELVLIDAFLALGENRSLMYLAPETYVNLPLLNSLLNKWGISMNSQRRLDTEDEKGYFSKTSQLYAKAYTSEILNADKIKGNLIIDNCTPITILDDVEGVTVSTIVSTKSKKVVTKYKEGYSASRKNLESTEVEDVLETRYPLVTLSEKQNGDEGVSKVLVYASVDFITSYFVLRNNKTVNYEGSTNGNLQLFATVMNNINKVHRDTVSGLADYAVKLSEMGIDTTSGYNTKYIVAFGVTAVAVPVVILLIIILIFSRRKRNGQSKQS